MAFRRTVLACEKCGLRVNSILAALPGDPHAGPGRALRPVQGERRAGVEWGGGRGAGMSPRR
jgi:hypothetical protein